MQKKTIDKIIRKKMNAWLASLPKELAEQVKPNILVSGGCIATLFLKEPVNDYDVYIQDMSVLMQLAEHYTKGKDIKCYDGRYLEQYLREREDETGLEAIHGEDLSEYTVFLKALAIDQVKLGVADSGKKFDVPGITNIADDIYTPVFMSQNAISLTNDLQVVTRFSGDHTEIHKNFDFMHATNYWTYYDGLITNIEAVESLLTKQLYYQGSLYPLTSVIRMKKFVLRGWKISAGEILKMLFQTSLLNLKDPVVLADQLMGVDIAYFGILIQNLQASGKEITNKHMMEAIDTVFNQIDLDNEKDI